MTPDFLTLRHQTIKPSKNWSLIQLSNAPSPSFALLLFPTQQQPHLSIYHARPFHKSPLSLLQYCNCSASSISPPSSKEEAILQAKNCLSYHPRKVPRQPQTGWKTQEIEATLILARNSFYVAVFLVPEASQLTVMKTVTDSLNLRPVVIFNYLAKKKNSIPDGGLTRMAVLVSWVVLWVHLRLCIHLLVWR